MSAQKQGVPESTRTGLAVVHMRRRRKDVWIETNDPKGGGICLSVESDKATEAHRELVRKVNALLVEFLVSASPPDSPATPTPERRTVIDDRRPTSPPLREPPVPPCAE